MQGNVARAQMLIGLLAALWLGWAVVGASSASAAEPIAIREILDEPRSFHLKQVTLQGTVRNVTPLDPYTNQSGSMCYGAYLFYLEDETSSINVAVYGRCGIPLVKDPDVEDGQRIELAATIQSPSHGGYYLSFQGVKVARDKEGVIQAVADRITPLLDEVKPQ
ncbi:MAG: hypothetical protein E8D47_07825 [Nitrospira sp.]|nr:MAG: hypothetical protein E8D47_07825 [Nitrospira sp.]